eukprot:CAMPEP_0172541598 /NCGR_PEP_ID=MMETSP1067-20121228/12384_1 /TAXON_ID=265564 ORGANISM="Thalassiosira punctigera, Strain Tpunct2005C2" /NCGR_SAMPLE_ID=MMETSP1067 /ASSEMBLY_ACC=CAM_ASM_000444 /LENGTH=39 /DNA_ID= /DNA_START= /DNA_END= /DNA_ORIENTATION=
MMFPCTATCGQNGLMDGEAIFCIFAFVKSSDAASEDCDD